MSGELKTYRSRRNFAATPEPQGNRTRSKAGAPLSYLIQRHAATRLHFDFRLEYHGVLKSWAVTKAPSRDPSVKRLAVEVEDHPIEYGTFEGTIPEGSYGAGTVQLWDRGTWVPRDSDFREAFIKGVIKMDLNGERLKGGWALVRLKSNRGKPPKRNNWLLIKERDSHAVEGEGDALAEIDASVATGRGMAEIAESQLHTSVLSSAPVKSRRAASTRPAASEPPAFVPIQLCTVADHPPSATGWAHEIKFDGYRIQIGIGGGRAILRTRNGLDWSDRLPELSMEAAGWPSAVVDGELCALNAGHTPDFSMLQAAIGDKKTESLIYFAFDLLFAGREDLRNLPLSHRKARLQAYVDRVGKAGPRLRHVEHFATSGKAVLESACRMDLEGIISKKLDAPYRSGRSSSWIKSKCRGRDEVIIGGWSSENGARLRSLLAGVKDGDGLRFLGRIGTGYNAALTKILLPKLKAAAADKSPFTGLDAPKGGRDIHWVRPVLVAEIEHGGYTETGSLRHAAYKGLREDKPAADVTETPQAPAAKIKAVTGGEKVVVAGVTISNPNKVLWPARDGRPAIVKAGLARYYERAAERILAHCADRPMSIVRAPDGIDGEQFFQRHAMPGSSPRLKLIDVKEREPYVAAVDAGGLAAIAQSGGVELHPWGCKPGDPETPNQITFDLDPGEGVAFAEVAAGAKTLKAKLDTLGLTPFVKTTGGKGLHVVVPIAADARRKVTWDQAKAFAKAVSEAIRADAPGLFTTNMAKKARAGKIYLDYLRNGHMATAVAPWSPRARPGAGIALPLSWSQLKTGLDPCAFNLQTAQALLKKPDPWKSFREAEAPLRPALKAMGVKA